MAPQEENSEIVSLARMSSRRISRRTESRRMLMSRHQAITRSVAALEEALEDIKSPHQRYRIARWVELVCLIILCAAEVVVANSVVQALGLTAIATLMVAVAVGGAATGMAWLLGHEWAMSRDPEAAAAGRRGWLRLTVITVAIFLLTNLAVRIYYGVLAEQAARLGGGWIAPLLSGALLTIVTAALIVIAAFITAHSETSEEARLRTRLKRLRSELRSFEDRIGILHPPAIASDGRGTGNDEAPRPSTS